MNKVIRLENTSFGFSSFLEDEVDKVLEFDPDTGVLNVHVLESSQRIPFGQKLAAESLVRRILGHDFADEDIQIIHASPIQGAYSAPFKIYLDINQVCSLECSFCLSEAGREAKASLPLEVIEAIAAEIKELGVMYVKIGGGDPFLHPDLSRIITSLRSAGSFITISTNSITLTPTIIRLLANAKVRTSVSIEGMEATDDSLRGAGHFHKALEALEKLKDGGVNVLFRTTVLRQNLKEVPDLVELARSRKVKIKFSYCRPAGRAIHNQMMLGPQDSTDYLKVLYYLNNQDVLPYVLMDEGMMFDQPKELLSKLLRGRMCGAANRSMHIDPNGRVAPCVFLGPTFTFGRVYQDGTIEDFWHGRSGNKFHAVRSIRQPQECDGCNRLCKNECPANRLYFWGNFERQDANCIYEALSKYDPQS